jgi:hypothetical protein
MDKMKKSDILKNLITLFDETNAESHSDGMIIIRDDNSCIVEQLLEEYEWREKFSERFIRDKINNIILRMVREDKNNLKATNYLDEMIQELDTFSIEQSVYIPLFGISKPSDEIEIGNITISWVDSAKTKGLEEKCRSAPEYVEKINKYIKEHVCSEFHCIAEPARALERAEEETRRAIDLIRYAIPSIYIPSARIAVGLHGEFCRSYRYAPIDPIGADSFAARGTWTGALLEFEFSPENIQKMKMIGINKLSEVLRKDVISEFENNLLSSIHWFANSQVKTENADRLLNLITCLEILFTPKDRDPIIQNVAEGAAIFIGDNVVDRKWVIDRIRGLYALRSSLSHHGKGIVLDSDVLDLVEIDCAVLQKLIDKFDEFNEPSKRPKVLKQKSKSGKNKSKKNRLLEWIEYTKLGGSPSDWDRYCVEASEPDNKSIP